MGKYEITKMLTISTEHITPETAEKLNKEPDANNMSLCVYEKAEFGWFIHIPEDMDDCEQVPDDLRRCIEFADEQGCEWLCIDCDGETVDELPLHEW